MLKIDDMIGDVLFIAFRDMGRMKEIGIDEQSGHFLLKGYDRIGIWLEHPGITIQHAEDVKGRPIPTNMQKCEEIDAVFIVNWDNINTMMHYPNRKGYDFPEKLRKEIGFRIYKK